MTDFIIPEENNVILSVLSRQSFPDGETDVMELTAEGRLREEGEAWVLTYREGPELADTLTTLRMERGAVTLSREGPFRSEMVFAVGRRHGFSYHTPYGDLEMAVLTDTLRWALTRRGGELEIAYRLEAGGQETGAILFQIHVREKEPT